jgi:hypothetical protein
LCQIQDIMFGRHSIFFAILKFKLKCFKLINTLNYTLFWSGSKSNGNKCNRKQERDDQNWKIQSIDLYSFFSQRTLKFFKFIFKGMKQTWIYYALSFMQIENHFVHESYNQFKSFKVFLITYFIHDNEYEL